MKKFFIYFGIISLFFTLIAGCSSSSSNFTTTESKENNESSSNTGTTSNYPSRPITIVVPWGPGGGSDQMVRAIVKSMEEVTDAQFVVQNMPGGSGLTGLNYVMQQPADGYTIYEVLSSQIIQMVLGQTEFTLEDITPIATTQKAVSFLFIRPDEDRFTNFTELMEYAKVHEGEVTIGIESENGFDTALISPIETKYGIKFKGIPFNNSSERYASLAGGHVDVLFEQIGDVISLVESGQMKPIIVYNDEPVVGFEDVPTTVENGIDLTTTYIRGFWFKNGVPQEAVDFMSDAIDKAVQTESWNKFQTDNFNHLVPGYTKSDEFKVLLDKTYEEFKENLN